MIIYNTTDTAMEFYENGTWVELSGVADASTTVKGVSEEATEAEMVAGTTAGGTGARLFVNPSSISAKILTDLERTFVRALTADATEINQLDGTTNIAEADTFFGATDLSGAEAETLSDGSNADALHVHTYSEKGVTSAGVTTVANTTTETDLLTFSLGANELSTNNAVSIKIPVSANSTAASGSITLTLRLKYGSTTVATATIAYGAGGQPDNTIGFIEATLLANASTAAQNGTIQSHLFEAVAETQTNNSMSNFFGIGTATEDSTGALTLAVTGQWSAADASNTVSVYNGLATIIK